MGTIPSRVREYNSWEKKAVTVREKVAAAEAKECQHKRDLKPSQ